MANIDINGGSLLVDDNVIGKNLLAFDDKGVYKLPLTQNTVQILNNKGLLVGKKSYGRTGQDGEIFNDYAKNQAQGRFAHAEGEGTKANSDHMHVQGRYNYSTEGFLHVVGNGTSENHSDAHTLDEEGNAWFAGDVLAGEASLQRIAAQLSATGSGQRRPIVRFGDKEPGSTTTGEIGDIYCWIIPSEGGE